MWSESQGKSRVHFAFVDVSSHPLGWWFDVRPSGRFPPIDDIHALIHITAACSAATINWNYNGIYYHVNRNRFLFSLPSIESHA